MATKYRAANGNNRLGKVVFKSTSQGSRTLTGYVRAGANVSLAYDQVNQMSLTLQDDTSMTVYRRGGIRKGSTVTFNKWLRFEVRGYDAKPDDGEVGVTLRSKGTAKLKDQTGGKSWGTQDVSKWIKKRFKEAGLTAVVQPGLGKKKIVRTKPSGGEKQSTWDVMNNLKDELGLWLFEAGKYGYCGRPTWFKTLPKGVNRWNLWWKSTKSMHAGLAGSPEYSYTADSTPHEQCSFNLISADAEEIKPGDIVKFTGYFSKLNSDVWIVTNVTIPLASMEAVQVQCQRVINPEKTTDSRKKKKKKKKAKKKKRSTKKKKLTSRKKKVAAKKKKKAATNKKKPVKRTTRRVKKKTPAKKTTGKK
ncbi:hypothetical protein [Brevibacterium moorei]|uniref:hypothetical protein n=1 Tax=Brevibacterium moorei TaxID=2968457 RepID=UPI00211C6E7F|nr:hypothetical protein [Brevibacterium sp. 68QC2CO]MCQ9384456.1 hypothetical protein [Brevibacterium sp. 68QC2CO]